MSKKTTVLLLVLMLLLTGALVSTRMGFPLTDPQSRPDHAIVIYGGSFAACAAAYQAAAHLSPGENVLMVVPESALGSIGTVGGQNFFYVDINAYQKGDPVQTLETPRITHITSRTER